ncbi:PnaS family phosphate:sodium (Na+) symporter [[Clostridium] ultunense Esp]|uniref:Na/Pi cotransporter family protein n=1 Tax=Thermicanus aegyptius TaxID=94009 RepID=UPI0002B6F977|nr:Na/Pi symporter [Thermicanus aegyptius]CCQ98413.1 PnaS family phosphate:sodium (Na+) symporter [[Clostridium] ultunense Esp]
MEIQVFLPILVGLILFFFGLALMRTGLEALAQGRRQEIIARFARTPLYGFITGTLVTAFLQSSSAVTILIVGFVNAGILTFSQSIGLILGANVGTTLTLQILAFSLEDFLLPLFLISFLFWLMPERRVKRIGLAMGGVTLMLLSLSVMGSGARLLLEDSFTRPFFLRINENPLIAFSLGLLATALIQSSTAMLATTMIFMKNQMISLPAGVAILLGSNIGTCLDTYLSSIGGSPEGKKVAYAHILLNVGGALLFLPLLHPFSTFISHLSPDAERQLAHAQTLFNLVTSLFVLPFSAHFARLIERITGKEKSPC